MKPRFNIDLRALHLLARDIRRGAVLLVRGATKRSAEVTREEVGSKRLGAGVTHELDLDSNLLAGRVVAEYYDRRPARTGTLHLASGRTKVVPLSGSFGDFNVLRGRAEGTGVYGPRGQVIRPRASRVLLIAVERAPAGESYITSGRDTFILRPRSRGTRPDDFVGRTASRVEGELPGVIDRSLKDAGV